MELQILINGIESNGNDINQNFSEIEIEEAIEWLQQLQE